MQDFSYLDRKYFIDDTVYNCPFCNRKNVPYKIIRYDWFNWTDTKPCCLLIVKCGFCENCSLHLTYDDVLRKQSWQGNVSVAEPYRFKTDFDIDSCIFYSVPTSFFVLDDRIKSILRELITEAEGCLKMNFLTGASACMRKAIYELLVLEKVEGEHYDERIKALKAKHPDTDPSLFDTLGHIQDMTSDKVHEQSWDKWDSAYLKLIIETLKTILHDIYVLPQVKAARYQEVQKLKAEVDKSTKAKKGT